MVKTREVDCTTASSEVVYCKVSTLVGRVDASARQRYQELHGIKGTASSEVYRKVSTRVGRVDASARQRYQELHGVTVAL